MERLDDGYFTSRLTEAAEGLPYAYVLDDRREYPDPASRWQPNGVHCPSAVFFPETFAWTDADWRGVARESLAIYELHVGAFTPDGTFDAIVPRLPQLADLGVTAIELMPVAQFPGQRNWGYDGVHPYAVQNSYGGPRAFQRLVDAAHRRGLAVILDVVYNHLGPEGNYLGAFGPYFTDRYHTPWGNAINFDGPECDAVRAVLHSQRLRVGPRLPRRRPPPRRRADDLRLRRPSHSRGHSGGGPGGGRPRRPHRPRHRREQPERHPPGQSAPPRRVWAGRRVGGRLPPQPPRLAHRAARRLLHGLRSARPSGEGDPRRLRLRRRLQPASPPSLRQPGGADGSLAFRRLRRTTTRWATTAKGTAWPPSCRPRRGGWPAGCSCSRPARRCCLWGKNTARSGLSPSFAPSASPRWPRRCGADVPRTWRRCGSPGRWKSSIRKPRKRSPRRS